MTEPYVIGEAVGKRTPVSKTYLRSDGSYEVHFGQRPVHYADADSNLHNIDTLLIDEADFDAEEQSGRPVAGHIRDTFRARAAELRAHRRSGGAVNRDQTDWRTLRVPHDVVLPKNLKKGYTVGHGSDQLTFVPVGSSPTRGQISPSDGSSVEYQDVWQGIDVRLTILPHGMKEELVYKSPDAPATVSWQVDGLTEDWTRGTLRVHRVGPMVDAVGTRREVEFARRTDTQGHVYIDVTPDLTGLVLPATLDPTTTFNVGAGADDGYITFVTSAAVDTTSTDLWNRYYDPGTASLRQSISLMRWDTTAIPDGANVSGATLQVYVTFANLLASPGLKAEWYDHGGTIGAEDWISPLSMGTTASAATRPSGTGTWSWTLSNAAAYVNKTGHTGLRIGPDSTSLMETDDFLVKFASYEDTVNAEPRLIVTYNQTPGAPVLTSPNGGETWNAEHTITWTAATDPDGDALQYHIQLSTNNGSSWSDVVALTTAGATSYTYNFSAVAESSTCLIRIQAYDGTSYGAWDQSDAVFTIVHNQAPLMPSDLSPSGGTGVDRAATQRLSWQHNDPNSSDPQSKFDLQWSSTGGSTWNTVTQATPNQYWDAPGGTFPHGNIVWKVRTYDQADLSGPYSDQVTFLAGDKPTAPVIVSPADGATTELSRPTLQWSSAGQVGYQAQALTLAGAVLWDSGDVTSSNKAATVGADLSNLTSYTLQVRIRNTDGLWSDYDSITVNVSYIPPVAGPFAVAVVNAGGYNRVTFSGQGADVASNDLYRRAPGGEWIRIATGLAVNATYDDYTAASGVAYEYQGQAIGTNGVATATDVATATLALTGVWVHDVADTSTLLHLTRNVARGDEWLADVTMLRFAGRDRPVAAFGTTADGSLHLQFLITDRTELDGLQALAQRLATLCVRDNSGRRVFGIIPGVPVEDRLGGFWTVSVDVQEVDHNEEV